jgi:hypothetical protein
VSCPSNTASIWRPRAFTAVGASAQTNSPRSLQGFEEQHQETIKQEPKMNIPSLNLLILTVNLLSSTLVFWVAAALYLIPKLPNLEARSVVLPILLLHVFGISV